MACDSTLLTAALGLAAAGWSVLPCRGKRPLTSHGVKDATTDAAQIKEWWTRWPDAQTALRTGKGTFVLDVDLPDGPASLAALEAEHGPLPKTRTARTGSGGEHRYFRLPEGRTVKNSAGKLAPGLDVRGEGGYVIAPPTPGYSWLNEGPIADAPEWLLDRLQKPASETTTAPSSPGETTPFGLRALQTAVGRLSMAVEGTRNHALNAAAFNVGQLVAGGELAEAEARAALENAALGIGLEPDEIKKTLDSGLRAGARTPERDPASLLPEIAPIQVPKGFTARELQGMEVEPPRWAVENLIPRGLSILAGPPKIGKSFFTLLLGMAVARGEEFLGRASNRGEVAYLALEDGPSRLKKRMGGMFGDTPWPEGLHFFVEWPRLGEGGLKALDAFLGDRPSCRLIIIDTWAKLRKRVKPKGLDAYQADSIEVGELHGWAHRRGIALVFTTHLRKTRDSNESDPFERITGSMGAFGCADMAALLTKKRGEDSGQLQLVGRDLEEDGDLRLIKRGNGTWELDDGLPRAGSPRMQAVLDALMSQPGGMGPKKIATLTGENSNYIKQTALPSLIEIGLARKIGHAEYVATFWDEL